MNNQELCKILKSISSSFDGEYYSILFVDDKFLNINDVMNDEKIFMSNMLQHATMVVTKSGKIIKNRYGPIDEIKI